MKNLIVNFLCQKFVTILQYFTILKYFDITLTLFVRHKYIIFDINCYILEKFEKNIKIILKKQAAFLNKTACKKIKKPQNCGKFLLIWIFKSVF